MPIIKPVSDLRNYPDVLKNVGEGSPVYLTKNGTGRYVLMDIQDYGRIESVLRLAYELQRGKKSGETQGWISQEEMMCHFKDRVHA
ncbi:MAG: type II toxin-antitoxin system prevent-host-death family antitoxin [Kiritimatiellae bacterium]|nr:type II toxin-antitoxin system prevent-host-death family antitoxin [Kiritimatiellia bacterium]